MPGTNNCIVRNYSQSISSVKLLVESKKLTEALQQFYQHPSPHDAAFLIGKGIPIDECLKMYDTLRLRNNTSLVLVVSLLSACVKQSQSNTIRVSELRKELFHLLNNMSPQKKKRVNEITWNFALKQLALDAEFDGQILILVEDMLKLEMQPLEGTLVIVMNSFYLHKNAKNCMELVILLQKYQQPISVKYYTFLVKTLVSTNNVIEATRCLENVSHYQVKTDAIFYTSIISSCIDISNGYNVGKLCHEQALIANVVDTQLQNTLISFYCKYGDVDKAYSIFQSMKKKTVATWTSMISGFSKHKRYDDALQLFSTYTTNSKPDENILLSVMNVYASKDSFENTKQFLDSMYDRFGVHPTVRHYGCLIKSILKEKKLEEAMTILNTLEKRGEKNSAIYSMLISYCIEHCEKSKGIQLYESIISDPSLFVDNNLINLLIRMLSKFGDIDRAYNLFMRFKNSSITTTWTTMIHGLGLNGRGKQAIDVYFEMLKSTNFQPDAVTFTSLLTACSHSGLVCEAMNLYESMKQYGVEPAIVHVCCMVDVFGRAGKLDEAEEFVNKIEPNIVALTSLMGSCRIHKDVRRAERVFDKIMAVDNTYSPAYVQMSNIYAACGEIAQRNRLRELMDKRGLKKIPGETYIEINGKVHVFYCEENKHPQKKEIYEELKHLSKQLYAAGFKQDTIWVTRDMNEDEKKELLCKHSEKIAIAYGLISTPAGTPLTLHKNLRVCGDCHEATKMISKIKKREITVGDANRIHHFKDGKCSCGDYF